MAKAYSGDELVRRVFWVVMLGICGQIAAFFLITL